MVLCAKSMQRDLMLQLKLACYKLQPGRSKIAGMLKNSKKQITTVRLSATGFLASLGISSNLPDTNESKFQITSKSQILKLKTAKHACVHKYASIFAEFLLIMNSNNLDQ